MIDINVEFSRGVLFVRLQGILDNSNVYNIKSTIIEILKNGGIRYLVFNIHNLIINDYVDLFDSCEDIIKLNDGKMLICGLEEKYRGNYNYIDNELLAYKVLEAC